MYACTSSTTKKSYFDISLDMVTQIIGTLTSIVLVLRIFAREIVRTSTSLAPSSHELNHEQPRLR